MENESRPKEKKTGIFIIPQKIQRRRLEDIKKSMIKKQFVLLSEIGPDVTHVVTEYETVEEVKVQLEKDRTQLPEQACLVSIKWLVDCLKTSHIVPVKDSHLLKKTKTRSQPEEKESSATQAPIAEWACQRGAKLDHFNTKLTTAIEVLQQHAEMRDGEQDYSRALAFRRASCVFKSLPFPVKDISQLDGLKDIGGHVKRVVKDILETGHCSEVDEILQSQWFMKMKEFTSVFGVGSSTANKWIHRGFETLQDVKKTGPGTTDWRVTWGLAFHEDLSAHVQRHEAERFTTIVHSEAEKIIPGVIVQLTGGFRRGKPSGHDVDLLISHPTEGAELDILPRLLSVLEHKGFILIGHREKSSFRPETLVQDFKLSMRGQLDHFEKWIGMCKFPKTFQQKRAKSEADLRLPDSLDAKSSSLTSDNITTGHENSVRNLITKQSACESVDEAEYEPRLKKLKQSIRQDQSPESIASSERNWTARRVDLIVSPYSQYYYALVGWTGSKHFNRDARLYAQKSLGMKLTSHGLYDNAKQVSIPATSEKEVFSHLKLPYRDPIDRNC